MILAVGIDVTELQVIFGGEDFKIWDLDQKGTFLVKSQKAALRTTYDESPKDKFFWRSMVHLTLVVQYWNIWKGDYCATQNLIIKKLNKEMPTRRCICKKTVNCCIILFGIAYLLRGIGYGLQGFLICNRL